MAISQQQQEDHDNKSDEIRILLLQIITFSATAFYVTAWGCFQVTPCWYTSYGLARTIFWNPKLMILAYPCVVGILACTVPGQEGNDFYFDTEAKVIFSLAAYPLTLFPFVVLPLLYLKKNTQRSRPAPMDLAKRNESENWIQHKKFQAVTYLLARSCGDKCFPSADVAMAVLLAIPLWEIGGSCKGLAVAIVLLSGLERMYVLAHYLSDVLAGGLITLGLHGRPSPSGMKYTKRNGGTPSLRWEHAWPFSGGFKSIEF
jgi:membrane-associated phospholipid phosphatase